MAPTPPSSRRQVRTRTRPAAVSETAPGCTPPAAEPDLALYELVGLDETGIPAPATAYELDIERRHPDMAYEMCVERCAAHATAHLLRLAVEHVDRTMGEGSAQAYPEIVAAFIRSSTAIRNQDLWREHTMNMMRRGGRR